MPGNGARAGFYPKFPKFKFLPRCPVDFSGQGKSHISLCFRLTLLPASFTLPATDLFFVTGLGQGFPIHALRQFCPGLHRPGWGTGQGHLPVLISMLH